MAAPEVYCVVVVAPNGKRHDARERRLDVDDQDELRETLISTARKVDSYLSGSASGGEWLDDWELRLYTPHEASKGTYEGGWAQAAKVATFPR